ncbi:MAG: lytic transglycosylase domain-containing protein, partial [Pseudomonadota bacterium]
MLTTVIKGVAALFAGVSGLALSGAAQPEAIDVRIPVAAPLSPVGDAIAGAVAQWKRLNAANGTASFYDYSAFLLAHPGWPNELALRRATEKAMANGGWTTDAAAAFFRRFPPLTSAAAVRYAQALIATGQAAEANAVARKAWSGGVLAAEDEATLLTQFGGALTPADHDRRMDALLWQGATTSAARQVGLTSTPRRAAFQTRLAFRSSAPEAGTLAVVPDALNDADAGYLADKALWLKLNGATATARTLLANRPVLAVRPGNPEKWFELLLDTARGAAAEGQYDLAFRIASRVDDAYPTGTDIAAQSYGERDKFTDLMWFAGQTALKQLGRPGDAVAMFDRYSQGSRNPALRTKGIYWAARAAQAAGRADATSWFARAGAFGDQFYGQLANEQLGAALRPPVVAAARPVEPAARDAFYQREIVRAAQYLGSIGDHESQSAFVRQIANDAKSDADHALATQLATSIGRADLAVMIGRSALLNGLSDYRASGFPNVAVPIGYENEFTLIHAIARQESQFDRAAVSHAGARGLMQLMPGTAREQSGKLGLGYDRAALTVDTQYNIQLGSSYFQRMYANYGSYPLAVAAYNAGPGNVNKWLRANGDPRTGAIDILDWIELIPLSETRNYVQRVL